MTTMIATPMMAAGYTIAALTFLFSAAAFSMYADRRCSTTSRIPPASPTSTRLVNSSSNVRGCRRSASASVDPASTLRATWPVTDRRVLDSLCSARMFRHCTRGNPASIMVENWRVKIAISLSLTLPPNLNVTLGAVFSEILVTRIARRRSSPTAAERSDASISPVCSPFAERP